MYSLSLVRASKYDASSLTKLAIDSEHTWGFNQRFMEIFTEKYSLTDSFIENNLVFKMMEDEVLIGFFGLIKEDFISELEYFYIDASHIGRGYGKQMWQMLCELCLREHIGQFEFVAGPEAVHFYKSCGAIQVDTVESLILPGRMIPKFVYQISKK